MPGTAPSAAFSAGRASSGRYRFGPFEVDFRTGELRKSGLLVHTQDQPLQVLSILLSRSGEIATREEFRALLWPAHTFVDFDHGLNAAIKRLRHLLEDDPENPRYIETLPRHGYRFIAPVLAIEAADCGPSSPSSEEDRWRPATAPLSWERVASPQSRHPSQNARHHRLRVSVWTVGVALLAGAVVFAGMYKSRRKQAAGRQVLLAVLPLADFGDTANHFVADGMTEELITQLGKANLEGVGIIAHTSVGRYKNTRKSVTDIGKELGVDYVLEGSARVEKQRVRIAVQLIRVSDQTHLWADEYDSTLDDVLGLQTSVAADVVGKISSKLPHASPN